MVGEVPPFSGFVARRYAARSPFWSWLVFERIGGALAFVLGRLGASPNQVTVLGGLVGISGATVLGTADGAAEAALAACLLATAYSLDCADGQLARATGRTSEIGAWLDVTVDAVVTCFLTAGLAVALAASGEAGLLDLLLTGAFGAARISALLVSTRIKAAGRRSGRRGLRHVVQTVYGSLVETPFVYLCLCGTRIFPGVFEAAIASIAVLTVGRTVVSYRRHARPAPDQPAARDELSSRTG